MRSFINENLVKKLIARQFPEWANEPIKKLFPCGMDHRSFRLGNDKIIRLPRDRDYRYQVVKDNEWLSKLAPQLPFSIPEQIALGKPQDEYPYSWAIYRWIEGIDAKQASEI